MTVNFGVSSRL